MTKELALEIAEGFASAAKENADEGFPRMAERLALADRCIRLCIRGVNEFPIMSKFFVEAITGINQ